MLCRICNEEKPETEFYISDPIKQKRFNECKLCVRNKQVITKPGNIAREIPGREGEALVVAKLIELGIYAAPGKCSAWYYVDVVAWGCVKIEVKFATYNEKRNGYGWHISPLQAEYGFQADLLVLVCRRNEVNSFYVFDTFDSAFYTEGKMPHALTYTLYSKGSNRHAARLTDEKMRMHKDRWQMVEQVRQQWITNH